MNISASGLDNAGITTQAFQATGLEKILVSNFNTGSASQTFDTTLVSGLTTVGTSSSGAAGDTVFTGLNAIVAAEMKNGAGDLTLTYGATAIAGTADTQALAVSNMSAGTFVAAGVETVAVTTSLAASTLTAITATSATKITVAGDQNLTVTGAISTAAVDASTMTGALTMLAGAANQTITGGTGNDVIDMSTNLTIADVINGGDGTDTLKLSVGSATIDATAVTGELIGVTNVENIQINSTGTAILDLNGFAGVSTVEAAANVLSAALTVANESVGDTITFTLNGTQYTTAAIVATATSAAGDSAEEVLATKINAITGFTGVASANTVTITNTGASSEVVTFTIDSVSDAGGLDVAGGADGGAFAVSTVNTYNDVSFNNLAAGVALDVYSADSVTYALKDASGLTDSATVNLKTVSADKGFSHTVGTLVVTEVETLNLDSSGLVNTAAAYSANTLTTLSTDSKLTTLNITGDTNLSIGTMGTATKLATINASTATGNVSVNGVTTLAQTITTGSGNDTIVMSTFLNNTDTIDGGSNTAVIVSGVAGADTLTADVSGLTATTGALKVSNVENLNLTNTGTAVINAAGITGASQIAFTGAAGTTTVSNLGAAAVVGLGFTDESGAAVTGTTTLSLADETGTTDSITVNLNEVTSNTLNATSIETVNFAFNKTAAIAVATSTLTVSALNAKTITVTGADIDTATILALGTLDTDTTTVDASTYKGVLTMAAGTGTAMTISANGALANTITTSTGSDTITLAGNLGTSIQVINGSTGTLDTLNATANNASTDFTSVSGFETVNLTIAASATTGVDAAAKDDGLNLATTVNILGGNSISTFTLGTAAGIVVNTAATTFDASTFAGTSDITFVNGALNSFMTVKGGASTTDTARTTVSTTLTGAKVASMTGIETLVVTSTDNEAASSALDIANVTGLVTIDAQFATVTNADIITLSNVAAGVNVKLTSTKTADNLVVGLTSSTGTADSLNVELTAVTDAAGVVNLDVVGLETLNINNIDAAGGVTVLLDGVAATAGSTTTVNVAGTSATTLTSMGATITTVNASTSTGGVTIAAADRTTSAMTITGSATTDSIAMKNVADVLNGGSGTDTLVLSYTAILGGIQVDLSATGDQVTSLDGSSNAAVQSGFENVDLSAFVGFGAVVTGSTGDNTIVGTALADNITGGDGADIITGGAGADIITGGAGNDTIHIADATDINLAETISGGTGTNVIQFDAANVAITDADFANMTLFQTLTLANATNTVVLGTAASATGFVTINGGTGADAINVAAMTNATSIVSGGGVDVIIAATAAITTIDLTAEVAIATVTTSAITSAGYFNVDADFAVANDLLDYNGAVSNGTGAVIAGAEDGTGRASLSLIATNKTSVQLTTAMTNDIIDGYIAGTSTIAQLKAAAIVSFSTVADSALANGSKVLAFTIDNEDTAVWYVSNTNATANAITADEIELVGIINGDMLTAAEMATVLI